MLLVKKEAVKLKLLFSHNLNMPRKRNPEPTVSITIRVPISVYDQLVDYAKNIFPPTTVSALLRALVIEKLKEEKIVKEEVIDNENA